MKHRWDRRQAGAKLFQYPYPQARQQRPGVEFIPVPYRTPEVPGEGENPSR